jgi:hypothetical protein
MTSSFGALVLWCSGAFSRLWCYEPLVRARTSYELVAGNWVSSPGSQPVTVTTTAKVDANLRFPIFVMKMRATRAHPLVEARWVGSDHSVMKRTSS